MSIASSQGEIYDGVSERHHGEDLTRRDISSFDRGMVSAGVRDGGVSVRSAVPLQCQRLRHRYCNSPCWQMV